MIEVHLDRRGLRRPPASARQVRPEAERGSAGPSKAEHTQQEGAAI